MRSPPDPVADAVPRPTPHVPMAGQVLQVRLRRTYALLRSTGAERGLFAALLMAARIVLRKGPILLRQTLARRTGRAVLSDIRGTSAAVSGRLAYLAFTVTGGVGDLLVLARFVRDLSAHVGGFRFDVFCPTPKLAAWTFGALDGFGASYHDVLFAQVAGEYDVAMRLNQVPAVFAQSIRWASLRAYPRLVDAVETIERALPRIAVLVEQHPWLDNFLGRTAVFEGHARRDYLQAIAGLPYGGELLAPRIDAGILARSRLQPRHYITVHNGFDAGFVISGARATKCYPHFGAVVALLRQALPQFEFVQVGTITSEPIAECTRNLIGKTTLEEAAGLLRHARLHLDNESGLVHLAACLGTRSAVVFGPTPADYFGYPDNINIDPPVCGNCWWMTRTWMDICPKGYGAPRCLTEQDPRAVAERVLAALRQDAPPCERPAPASAIANAVK